MTTLAGIERHFGSVPAEITVMLREIDRAQGREEAFRRQHPQQLDTLLGIARIQSTEASNEIEGITAPPARIRALVEETTTPKNRPEEEIAGYRSVLDLIHSSDSDAIPFTVNVVRQFHTLMYGYSAGRGGDFKMSDNEVIEQLPDGTRRVRFTPVPAWRTAEAMSDLHASHAAALASGRYHPLLLAAGYVLDFLVVHPFSDGNGRMSRLLSLLLLYQGGYDVGRFISLEKLIADSRQTYYESLQVSTERWHDGAHDATPWTRYFLGILIAAYRDFEQRVGALGGRGSKTEAIRRFVCALVSDDFTIADVRRACPGVSDDLIRKVLAALRAQGMITNGSRGPAARYRRLRGAAVALADSSTNPA